LSPRENRSVPPIRYDEVYRLKALYPNLHVELNGQIRTLEECAAHLDQGMDGLMIGRASYESPVLMAQLDAFEAAWLAGVRNPAELAGASSFDRRALVLAWADYIDRWQERGLNPRSLVWPILELFPGVTGARKYRQVLSRTYTRGISMAALAREALAQLPGDAV
jgi:tRNA-dihydrouridine synthase A